MKLTPKNWQSFQHYKNRRPVWIKLHRSLLDDYDFSLLPLASKALAPMLWLLASEYYAGEIDCPPKEIAFRLRVNLEDLISGLSPLIKLGLFIPDSDMLASCKQVACPEREIERETETQEKKDDDDGESASLISNEAKELSGKIVAAVGHDPSFIPPSWFGAEYRIQSWLSNGWSSDAILTSIQKQMATRGSQAPPSVIQYFEKGIADFIAQQSQPLPKGTANGYRGPRPLQDDSLSASRAAARLAERAERGEIIFGPRPSLLPANGPSPVGLLPKGRDT